jgi:hypothetical protein
MSTAIGTCHRDPRPVDTIAFPTHHAGVNKKSRKVAESASSYAAKKPEKAAAPAPKGEAPGVRYMDDATFKKASDKVFKVHHELFRKLAQ